MGDGPVSSLMDTKNALARLSDVAERGLPLFRKLATTARRAAEEVSERLLGSDFESRAQVLRERYAAVGGDPFGFDPDTARQAAMVSAFFHRMYFRTEVYDIDHVPKGR